MSNTKLVVFLGVPKEWVIKQLSKISTDDVCNHLQIDSEDDLHAFFNFLDEDINAEYKFFEIQYEGRVVPSDLVAIKPKLVIRWDKDIEMWFDEVGYMCHRIQEVENHAQNLIDALRRYGQKYEELLYSKSHIMNETYPEIIYEQVTEDRNFLRQFMIAKLKTLSVVQPDDEAVSTE
jgi:hypothetical protein